MFGYAAHQNADALSFLKSTVSQHGSWKVQEILAMAFDNHCNIIGYEAALPVIREWLDSMRQCAAGCIGRIAHMDEPPVFQGSSTDGH